MTATKQPYMPMVAHKLPVDTSTRLKFQGADGECVHVGSIEGSWNARRIAASWNACRNLPVEMLETVGQMVTEGAMPHRVLTMKYELLVKELNDLRDTELMFCHDPMGQEALTKVDAAISAMLHKLEQIDVATDMATYEAIVNVANCDDSVAPQIDCGRKG